MVVSTRVTVKPGAPFSTSSAVMPPRARFCASVTVITISTSATWPPLMKCLRPLIFQPPSTLSARVVIAAESEPAPGSVRAKAARISPVASLRTYFSRCAGLP